MWVWVQHHPTLKLEVNHSGSTGILSKSTASFSVMDIDAFSGDAALRFYKGGVGKWNTRNNPSTDYFEIIQLGGGGQRLSISQTGNVGISKSTPLARLDVTGVNATDNNFNANGGGPFSATTIAGFSDVSTVNPGGNKVGVYSVVSGASGLNAGILGVTSATGTGTYNIGIYGYDLKGGTNDYAGYFIGKVFVSGTLTTSGPKPFTIDHPLDPENKTLHHFAIESPEVLNLYSGNAVTDASSKVIITLPDYFEAINKDYRYQLTVIGSFAQAIISKEITNNQFEIATNQPNIKVSWEVKALRNDGYMKYVNTMQTVEDKVGGAKGKYYTPQAHKISENRGIMYMEKEPITTTKIPAQSVESTKGTSVDESFKK